jgi:penicillin-binding protein 2
VTDRSRLRLVVLGVLVISLVATLIGRLWYLQVLAAPQFRAQALDNRVRDIVTQAPRGEIVDDMGRPLIDNKTALVVSVDRTALDAQPDGGHKVLERLSKLLHKPYVQLNRETTACQYVKTGNKVTGVKVSPCYSGSPYQPIPVSKLKPSIAATKRALEIQEMQEKYPGVSAQLAAVRHYPKPHGALASAILGYTGPITQAQLKQLSQNQQAIQRNSSVGYTGLEASYNRYLRGKPGVKEVTVDHIGAVTGTIKDTEPRQGDDIVTNLDAKAQASLEHQLQLSIDAARHSGYTGDYAAGVVLNAQTGGVVAMASVPTYNPSKPPSAYKSQKKYRHFANSEGHPFVDKAYASVNPPGSTFKGISSSGLLWDHSMSTSGAYECPTFFMGHHNFDIESGRGYISLRDALIVSCDTFFFKLGYQDYQHDQTLIRQHNKPIEGVQHIANDYGIGKNPHIDLPGAAWGHIGNRQNTKQEWETQKSNYCKGAARRAKGTPLQRLDAYDCKYGYIFEPGDQENEDIGQGTVDVSPLQLAVAYSAIANGGTVYEPHVAKAIMSPSGTLIKRIKPKVRDHIPLSQSELDYLRSAFYGVTSSTTPPGTATSTFAGFPMNKVAVGGKTGTAELSGTNQNGSWFVSFAGPAGGKPQYVTVIEVDKSNQGAISAAPFVRNMWDSIYGFGGDKAVFPNGVPPTALPKVGPAAIRAQIAAHKAHLKAQRKQQQSPGSTTTGTPSPPPSSPSTTAGGLPPGLSPDRRSGLVS